MMKAAIWLYFWLLIFEGALRRWGVPSLAGPLVIVRDPVAIWIIVQGLRSGVFPKGPFQFFATVVALASFVTSLAFGHHNFLVASFGLRIFIIHLPLLFIIGRAFDARDVMIMGRCIALLAGPMVLLLIAQFLLPQTHWINSGIGGEGTAGFGATAERFRPPGTFSFTSGATQFFSLCTAFIVAFGLLGTRARSWWWILGVFATVLAIPFSLSRGLVFQIAVTTLAGLFVVLRQPKLIPQVFTALVVCAAIGLCASLVPGVRDAIEAFLERWNSGNETEGGLVVGVFFNRFLGGLLDAVLHAGDIPIFGFGLGLGTNAGAVLMTGDRAFLTAEGEWLRIVGEMGPIFGMSIVVWRVALAVSMLRNGLKELGRSNPFPFVLASVAAMWVAQGNWAQPTSLGFSVLAGGLVYASARVPRRREAWNREQSVLPTVAAASAANAE